MPENNLFEYAVLRVVPKVEREEFLNVGIIFFCQSRKYLQMLYSLDEKRLTNFSQEVDLEELKARLDSFEKICKGGKEGGSIGELPAAQRFRWLTAAKSTILQTSPVHPGLCENPDEAVKRLYEKLIL
jgi:hypothetical protein